MRVLKRQLQLWHRWFGIALVLPIVSWFVSGAILLFVKPLTASARTNMTVVTDRHTYFFDLVAASSATPVYALRFTYPEELKPAAPPQQAGVAREALRDPMWALRAAHDLGVENEDAPWARPRWRGHWR